MRYREFKLTEEQLEELRMNPKSLTAFAKSPLAKGIQAGFEAELVFPGLGGEGDDIEEEPDYDVDESADDIDDIIRFFEYDDYGYGLSDRESRNLYNQLIEAYQEYSDDKMMSEFGKEAEDLIREYIEENEWDWDERIREYLTSELKLSDDEAQAVMDAGQKATSTKDVPDQYAEARDTVDDELRSRAELSLNDQDDIYDSVLDQFREDFEPPEEREFLEDSGLDYMSDVAREYDLTWPYLRTVGGGSGDEFDEYNAQQLADDWSNATGAYVHVSGSYHGQQKDTTSWYFEPDSSLDADTGDMPVEIVSPPMALAECLEMLDKFWAWAETHDAYTNSSTGFHMGVSLPEVGGKVDFVKLALFLGDEYVLQEFGRQAVGFCESAIKKIKSRIKNNKEGVTKAMAQMRNSLIDLAHNSIASDEGFGKYTSINPKGNYIEFRSAGGKDYSKDIPRLKNILLRYAQAMVVAADPKAERQEYYKKLYKLIAPASGDVSLDLFARFAAGTITKETLKQQWATATLEKEAPHLSKTGTWKVYDKATGKALPGYQYSGYTETEAFALVKQAMSPGSTPFGFKRDFDEKYELRNISSSTGKWAIINSETNDTLEVVDSETRGPVADLAMEKYGDKGIGYYIEPVPVDTPKSKLSRRAELAKRIKGPPIPGYYIINDNTKEIVYLFDAGSTAEATEILAKYKELHSGRFLYGHTRSLNTDQVAQGKKNTEADTTMEKPAHQQSTPRHPQQVLSPNGVPMWEIYNRVTGLGLHQFADHTQNLAWQTAQQWAQEQGFADRMNLLSVRPVMPQD